MNPLATTTDRGISARASQASAMNTIKNVSEAAGRTLLSVLFLMSGAIIVVWSKRIASDLEPSPRELDKAAIPQS